MHRSTRKEVYQVIDTEREYQNVTWENNGVPNELSLGDFILLLEIYVQKTREQWAKEGEPRINTLEVLRKVAGISVHAMEQHGAIERQQFFQ